MILQFWRLAIVWVCVWWASPTAHRHTHHKPNGCIGGIRFVAASPQWWITSNFRQNCIFSNFIFGRPASYYFFFVLVSLSLALLRLFATRRSKGNLRREKTTKPWVCVCGTAGMRANSISKTPPPAPPDHQETEFNGNVHKDSKQFISCAPHIYLALMALGVCWCTTIYLSNVFLLWWCCVKTLRDFACVRLWCFVAQIRTQSIQKHIICSELAFCTQLAHRALRRTSSPVSYAHTVHNTHSIYAEKVMIASNAGGMPNLDALIKINVNENNCHIWTIFVLNSMFPGRVIHLCNVHIYTQKPAIRNIGIFSIRLNLVLHFVFTFSIIMQHTTVTQTHIHYETMS